MVDESDIITNITQLREDLSQETLLELNPYVEDVEKEKKRLEEDEKRALEKMEDYQMQQDNESYQQDVDNNVDNLEEE